MQPHPHLSQITTPLHYQAWKDRLRYHPDAKFANFILEGLQVGFCIGISPGTQFRSAQSNMQSAKEHPHIIEEYLHKETMAGQILGPFPPQSIPGVHINRFGVIPKKSQPGKWCLITDLSFPNGHSINDAISPELCMLQYISVNQVALAAVRLGRGALLAKTDIKAAYRLIPVHPMDRVWLGMKREDLVYVDGMLPFGLRFAPKLFNAVADALEWCIYKQGVEFVHHYLDDFIVAGPPESSICQEHLDTLEKECTCLGVLLAPEKREGPSPVINFLGIIIDTLLGQLRLPDDKLQRLMQVVSEWLSRKVCTRRELESLIGTLQHACKVVRPGRSFLRRAISLLSIAKCPHHHVRLNHEFHSDLMWWKVFGSHWNGTALFIDPCSTHPVVLTSDASGSRGCGAWCGSTWFQLQWEKQLVSKQIAVKELLPIIIAAAIWGHSWGGQQVICRCDNAAVVAIINSRRSRERDLMQLLRCLFFIEAYFQFQLSAVHLPGDQNVQADDLSRNRLSAFHEKVPESSSLPSPIPPTLLQWLTSGLDLSHLDPVVHFFCRKGIADSTHKTYQSALHRFGSFCSLYSIVSPFPVSEALLCYYASFLATQRLTPQTIKTYLSAIRSMQVIRST